MNWLETVKNNIFPLSNEKNIINTALSEWEYRGVVYDPMYADEQCQICGHQDIRYQFEIINIFNSHTLLIGSECIKKFNIPVVNDSGNILSDKQAIKKVDKDRRNVILNAKTKSVLNSLIDLSRIEQKFDIENFIKYYKERGAFTPLQLVLVIQLMDKNKILYNKSYFKTIITRNREKEQLINLGEWKLKIILPCLTKAQHKFLDFDKQRQEILKNMKEDLVKKI